LAIEQAAESVRGSERMGNCEKRQEHDGDFTRMLGRGDTGEFGTTPLPIVGGERGGYEEKRRTEKQELENKRRWLQGEQSVIFV